MSCNLSVNKRIEMLRNEMQTLGMDAYIIPSADFHQTEYVGEHFKAKAFISGFNGSAGTVVVTTKGAYLWTDAAILFKLLRSFLLLKLSCAVWVILVFQLF